MVLQPPHHLPELLEGLRVQLLQIGQAQRVPDSCDHVLALRVDQVVAVGAGLSRGRIPRERDTRAAVVAEIAEHHRADVDRGAEVVRDALASPIESRALGVPRVEHGADGPVELVARMLGELLTGVLVDELLERVDQSFEVALLELDIGVHALGLLGAVERGREHLSVDVEHRLAEHLQQPAIAVPGESGAPADFSQTLHALVVEADVEHRLHHPRHRVHGPGSDAHQQRVVAVAQVPTDLELEPTHGHGDLDTQLARLAAGLEIASARLGRDGESGRHRQPQIGHLSEVRTLAAEQGLLVLVSLREPVHELSHRHAPSVRSRFTRGYRAPRPLLMLSDNDGPSLCPQPGRSAALRA